MEDIVVKITAVTDNLPDVIKVDDKVFVVKK